MNCLELRLAGNALVFLRHLIISYEKIVNQSLKVNFVNQIWKERDIYRESTEVNAQDIKESIKQTQSHTAQNKSFDISFTGIWKHKQRQEAIFEFKLRFIGL